MARTMCLTAESWELYLWRQQADDFFARRLNCNRKDPDDLYPKKPIFLHFQFMRSLTSPDDKTCLSPVNSAAVSFVRDGQIELAMLVLNDAWSSLDQDLTSPDHRYQPVVNEALRQVGTRQNGEARLWNIPSEPPNRLPSDLNCPARLQEPLPSGACEQTRTAMRSKSFVRSVSVSVAPSSI
jgi:hypothetical protein